MGTRIITRRASPASRNPLAKFSRVDQLEFQIAQTVSLITWAHRLRQGIRPDTRADDIYFPRLHGGQVSQLGKPAGTDCVGEYRCWRLYSVAQRISDE